MDVFNLLARIGLDTSEYDSGMSRIAGGVGKATKVIGAAVAAGTAVVTKFGADAVSVGQDFDKAMAQVAATSGKTMDELNSEIQTTMIGTEEFTGTLREFAQYMGSTTAFSATEAAEALNYMALAGYDAKTSMDMLPTVLNLAAAGGMDLASASDMVTDAQTALGLTLPQTMEMVDQMARASSKSNTSVAQLGEAMLTIGANAKGLSGGTKELSTALGILADNGIKGGEAGTHLRNIMLALNPTTDAAVAAWESLGVSAYDAEGNLRPLQNIFGELSQAMDGMTDQEKTDIIGNMFNKTDLASVNALLDTSVQRWNGLSTSIMASKGSAEKMAETQLDNLAGDVTLFKSALEGAKIAVSDKLSPTLREFVKLGADGLGEITAAFQEDGLSGAMEVFGELLAKALNMVIEMLPELVNAGIKLVTALVKGILDNIDTIVDAAFQIIDILLTSIFAEGNVTKILNAAFELINKLGMGIIQALPLLLNTAVQIITEMANSLGNPDNLNMLINVALDLIMALVDGLADALPALIDAVFQIFNAFVEVWYTPENVGRLLSIAWDLLLTLAKAILKADWQILQSISAVIDKVCRQWEEFDWKSLGHNMVEGILNGLKTAWSKLTGWVKDAVSGLVGGVKDLLGIHSPSKVFAEIGGFMAEGLGDGWQDEIEDVKKGINSDLEFTATPITTSGVVGADVNKQGFDEKALASAISEALDNYEIKWDDRNLGRLVRAYA